MTTIDKQRGRRRIYFIVFILVLTFISTLLFSKNKDHDIVLTTSNTSIKSVETVSAMSEPQIVIEPTKVIETPPETLIEPVAQEPVPTCASEIAKYDWDYQTAYNVMYAESTAREWIVNNNPDTQDYSVGCFQINLYGNNALTRPSEAELQNPVVNVEFAYRLYAENKYSFIGQWGVCRSKVQCY